QHAALDLSAYKGVSPVELFGRTQFPLIGDAPYSVTLGPHSFYWFHLTPIEAAHERPSAQRPGMQLAVQGSWTNVFSGRTSPILEDRLVSYLQSQRWFGGKARQIKSASFKEIVPIPLDNTDASLTQIQIEYTEEDPDLYILPLAFASGERADQLSTTSPNSVLASIIVRDKQSEQTGCLYDAVYDKDFCKCLVEMITKRRQLRGAAGAFVATSLRT